MLSLKILKDHIIALALLSLPLWAFAQGIDPDIPLGVRMKLAELQAVEVQAPDKEAVRKASGQNLFGLSVETNLDFNEVALVEDLPQKGVIVARLRIKAKGAKGLLFVYDDFKLPVGAKLFMYSADREQILGAYTAQDNKPHRKFISGIIRGEEAILEYQIPRFLASFEPDIRIQRVIYAFEVAEQTKGVRPSDFKEDGASGFGDALPCNIDVNCPEGNGWEDEERGVLRILRVFEEGSGWCTGSLINNTSQDGRPYVLSANHCIEAANLTPQLELWRFDFNYAHPSCATQDDEPPFNYILGCKKLAGRAESDFLLLELDYGVPYSYNAYFNGWNRVQSYLPPNSTLIHHPNGDVKKISKDFHQGSIYPNSIDWNNGVITPANHHFQADLDEGTFEGGSSGCPLFNPDGLIIGQLHGGNDNGSCSNYLTLHGRLSKSWDEGNTPDTRLQDWLDPENTGQQSLVGMETPDTIPKLFGFLKDSNGNGVAKTSVFLIGNQLKDTIITDTTGYFEFSNIPLAENPILSFYRNDKANNGVTTFDAVLIQKHILGVGVFTDPVQLIAADLDLSDYLTTFDLIELQKVILGLQSEFALTPSWQFYPPSIKVRDLPIHVKGFQVRAIKMGDVNFNADPH